MNRLTLPAVLMAMLLVVSASAVGAVAAPLASGDATATALQEGDGNTTDTPTPAPSATPTPAGDQSASSTNGTDGTNATATNDSEPTFGTVVSSFMQTSAAAAENEVEDGLFAAQFERSNASERARLVRQRTGSIGDRIAELREERAELLASGNATVRERAEAARLAAQSEGLANSIERTDRAAQRANVSLNRTALDELRTEARNLTGPEVAELARGLVDRDDSPRRGPPEDRGPRGDGEGTANESDTETPTGEDRPGRSGDAADRDRSGGGETGSNDGIADGGTETATATATPTPTTTDGDSGSGAEADDGTQDGESGTADE